MSLLSLFQSNPYLLAYALPLLFLSIPVTFSGTFLTLDRTRTFAPNSSAGYEAVIPGGFDIKEKRKQRVLLLGGLGGLAGGYLFGVHLSTLLALLIPGITSSVNLSSKSFVPVWLLTAILTTFLGGRWGYAALTFYGIAGGATFALSTCVIVHPSRTTRIVLVCVCVSILTLGSILPIARTRHVALRICTSSTGSFGMVLSIALLAKIPAWANVWERLWVKDDLEWGTNKEKGLSAAFCIFFAVGILSDWLLRRYFGENPDEKWDNYLANYAENLPNSSDRAGVFQPLKSPLSKLFGKAHHVQPAPPTLSSSFDPERTAFSDYQKDIAPPPPYRPKLQKTRSQSQAKIALEDGEYFEPSLSKRPGFLKKKSTAYSIPRVQGKRTREAVKFRPLGDASVLSSDSDDSDAEPAQDSTRSRPWLRTAPSSAGFSTSGTTLNGDIQSARGGGQEELPDVAKEKAFIKSKKARPDIPEYSDCEDDLGAVTLQRRASRDVPGWSPNFLQRHASRSSRSGGLTTSPSGSERGSGLTTQPTTPMRSVPATPSLIRAIDRVKQAQDSAYGFPPVNEVDEKEIQVEGELLQKAHGGYKEEQWTSFWQDVREKASQK